MFGSLKSLKACTAHISHWFICHEIRNQEGVNAPRLSVLGLFGFRKVTYTPRWREYLTNKMIMHFTKNHITGFVFERSFQLYNFYSRRSWSCWLNLWSKLNLGKRGGTIF